MGKVEMLRPKTHVTYDGTALTVVAKLSTAAILLHEVALERPPEQRQPLEEIRSMLEETIKMMSAIDCTFGRLERGADDILQHMEDGTCTSFMNRGSENYMVAGVITRRCRTLNVVEVLLNDNVNDVPEPAKSEDNVILFPLPSLRD